MQWIRFIGPVIVALTEIVGVIAAIVLLTRKAGGGAALALGGFGMLLLSTLCTTTTTLPMVQRLWLQGGGRAGNDSGHRLQLPPVCAHGARAGLAHRLGSGPGAQKDVRRAQTKTSRVGGFCFLSTHLTHRHSERSEESPDLSGETASLRSR